MKTIHAYDAAGTRVATFTSHRAAAAAYGLSNSAISQAVSYGHLAGGLRWSADADAALGPVRPRNAGGRPSRPVYGFDDAGTLVAAYPSVRAACEALGCSPASIPAGMRKGYRAAGLRWTHDKGVPPTPPTPLPRPALLAYDDAGVPVARYAGVAEAAQGLGVNVQRVYALLAGGGRFGSLRLAREGAPAPAAREAGGARPVSAFDDAGTRVATYASSAAAALAVNRSKALLGYALVDGHKRAAGLRWRYTEAEGGPPLAIAPRLGHVYGCRAQGHAGQAKEGPQ